MLARLCRRGIQADARDRREDVTDHRLLRNLWLTHGAVPKLCSAGVWRRRWHLANVLVLKRSMDLSPQAARYLRSNARLKCPLRVRPGMRNVVGSSNRSNESRSRKVSPPL